MHLISYNKILCHTLSLKYFGDIKEKVSHFQAGIGVISIRDSCTIEMSGRIQERGATEMKS